MAYGTFTLTGQHETPTGTPHTGSVVITPNTTIRDTAGDVIMSGAIRVVLDETGAWSVVLPCDSAELNPAEGIGYRVGYALRQSALEPQSFYATADMAGSTLDVSDIVTVTVPTPLSTVVTPEATATTAGKVRLAGDLGGTADAPTVPALADKLDAVSVDAVVAGEISDDASDTSVALLSKGDARWPVADRQGVIIPATIDHAGLADAFVAAASNGKRVQASGAYSTNQTLVINGDCDLSGLTITYTGTGIAVLVGTDSAGVYVTDKTIRLPRLVCSAPAGTWDGTSVGVKVINANQCRIWIPRVETFEKGVLITGNGGGTAYTDFYLGSLWVNHENLVLDQGSAGTAWVNQNQFYGGRVTHSTSRGISDDPNACHVRLGNTSGSALNPPDGNSFYGVSMEGVNSGAGGWARYRVINYGRYAQFFNCRWETSVGNPVIDSRDFANDNIVWGGYHASKIVRSGLSTAVDVRDGVGGIVKATNTSAQVLTSGTNTTVTGWTNGTLIGATYDSGTGTYTPKAGRWRISAKVTYGAATTTNSLTSRLICGTTTVDQNIGPSSTAAAVSHLMTGNYKFNGTETFKVQAQQSTGASLALSGTAPYVNLQAEYLGPV